MKTDGKEQLAELYKKIVEYVDDFDYTETKDRMIDNDTVELIEDFSKIFKFINRVNKVIGLNKFKAFLLGLSNRYIDANAVNKLAFYITDKEKAEFVIEILNKVFSSNSKKACVILGLLASKVMNERKILPEDLQLIACVSEMNDYDLINFKTMYDIVVGNAAEKYKLIKNEDIVQCCGQLGISRAQLEISINKLQKHGLIEDKYEILLSHEVTFEMFSVVDVYKNLYFHEASSQLYEYVVKVCDNRFQKEI